MIEPSRQLPAPESPGSPLPGSPLPDSPLPAAELGAPAERVAPAEPPKPLPIDDVAAAKLKLLACADAPHEANWIQRHPWRAIAAGLAAGVVLGSVPVARKGAVLVLKQFWPQIVRSVITRAS